MKSQTFIAMLWVCVGSPYADQGRDWISGILKTGSWDTTNASGAFAEKDLSHLWKRRKDRFVLGYVGADFQRLRIAFDSVQKIGAGRYRVSGKSRVYGEACAFSGSLEVERVFKSKSVKDACENSIRPTDYGVILGKYALREARSCPSAGAFSGVFSTFYFVQNGEVEYDTLDAECSDGFHNNDFVGVWESGKSRKAANWGDHRIPFSDELDVGAGEFFPAEKHGEKGWTHFRELHRGVKKDSLDTFEKDNLP